MSASPAERPVALTNAVVIDGSGSKPRRGLTVLFENGLIAAVDRMEAVPDGTEVLDLHGLTVMPGLIDAHLHLATWGLNLLADRDRTIPYLVARTASAMSGLLNAGCTAARDCGGLDSGLRDAVRDGLIPGPDISTSLTIISPTGGLIDPVSAQGVRSPTLGSIPAPDADGLDAVRAKVREVIRAGADFIKLATTGGVNSPLVHPGRTLFTPEEVRAIVDEAHAGGVRVACHAVGAAGAAMAVEAGVDSLEHGMELTNAIVANMAERGTWYVPTFTVYRWHETLGTGLRSERAMALHDAHRRSFAMARAAGIPIAMGTDSGAYGYDFSLELELLVEAGMTPLEAIRAGTQGSAACSGWETRRGLIAPGRDADLLVVDGDPSRDIQVIRDPRRIELVWQRGRLVGGARRASQALGPQA
jgi:imidazolonepropionase-like amidohydrolase